MKWFQKRIKVVKKLLTREDPIWIIKNATDEEIKIFSKALGNIKREK